MYDTFHGFQLKMMGVISYIFLILTVQLFIFREQELVYTVLKKLGGFCLTNTVELTSTHIVCGEPRRTLNLLKAISRGCWVLSKEWVKTLQSQICCGQLTLQHPIDVGVTFMFFIH